jgi:hypothetical protein
MTALSTEQLQDIQRAGNQPIRVVDPTTRKVYVILEVARFEQLQSLISDEPLSLSEQSDLLARMGKRVGWDDPEMDRYDNYDEEVRRQS